MEKIDGIEVHKHEGTNRILNIKLDEEISKKRIKLWGNSGLNTYKEILSNKNFL